MTISMPDPGFSSPRSCALQQQAVPDEGRIINLIFAQNERQKKYAFIKLLIRLCRIFPIYSTSVDQNAG